MKINHWFTGVVEDVNDPLQMGRVRVRCVNYHTSSQVDIPTQELPWSSCLLPVTSAATSGIGVSTTGLVPGSWVFGFFRDENEMQDAMIIGSLGSSSGSFPQGNGEGFQDPNGFFPLSLGADIPQGATTAGYNNGYVGAGAGDVAGSYAIPPSTFGAPPPQSALNGSSSKFIDIAKSQDGTTGAGVQKYWSATDQPSGYGQAWCAAFVCWVVQQSGVVSDVDRPKTASAFGFEDWARSKPAITQIRTRPTFVKAGDLIVLAKSHIGVAMTDSDAAGAFQTIDGNWAGRVHVGSNRNLSMVKSTITVGGAAAIAAAGAFTGAPPGAWAKELPSTNRNAGGLQFSSYGQPADLNSVTGDSNTRAKRGFRDNLLSPGSVALSPDIYKKYNPQIGAAVYVNDRLVGYYEDNAPASFNGQQYGSVIDIYDPGNHIGPILTNAGNAKISFGPARPQVRNA